MRKRIYTDEERKERARESKRRWRAQNPKKVREISKRYYAKNTEKVRERNKRYYAKNTEKVREINKRYYAKNTEKVRERNKRYNAENREKVRERYNRAIKKLYNYYLRELLKQKFKTEPTEEMMNLLKLRILLIRFFKNKLDNFQKQELKNMLNQFNGEIQCS